MSGEATRRFFLFPVPGSLFPVFLCALCALCVDSSWATYVAAPWCTPVGDVNCDSVVDFGDVNPFIAAVLDPDGYAAGVGADCAARMNADMNCDGFVDFDDINLFVVALTDPDWRPENRIPVARADVIYTRENQAVEIRLTGFDPDGGRGCP